MSLKTVCVFVVILITILLFLSLLCSLIDPDGNNRIVYQVRLTAQFGFVFASTFFWGMIFSQNLI